MDSRQTKLVLQVFEGILANVVQYNAEDMVEHELQGTSPEAFEDASADSTVISHS